MRVRPRKGGAWCAGFAAALAALLLAAPAGASAQCEGETFCAGAASVDMTWHVGSGQGQYGTQLQDDPEALAENLDRFDPFHHQTKMLPSHGMQSRLYAKAIVVRGVNGEKAALVKTDLYLQQDVLTRRVAELVSGADPLVPDFTVEGLDGSRIVLAATHNHSAPEYVSTAWGVWLFTDTFDFRAFETIARQIAEAIRIADSSLAPARMGGAVIEFDDVQRNILGPATADDGTPAGFPHDYFDKELAVLRFETDATEPEPIAAFVNLGMHPESLATSDFISSDFTGMVERIVERGLGRAPGAASGPVVVWSQGAVGDIEPDRDGNAHPLSQARQYWHKDFAQAERMSRRLGSAVLDAWADAGKSAAEDPRAVFGKHVAPTTAVPVEMVDHRFAGPPTHPLPTVSNCRTEHPGVPIIGLPDCEREPGEDPVVVPIDPPEQYGTTLELLRDLGLPVPDNYGAPAYGAVEESLRIHLQALSLGDVILVTVPGEPISDMVRNAKSRLDGGSENIHDGYDWPCDDLEGEWKCDFRTALHRPINRKTVDEDAYRRMVAEIHNDAAGWEDELATLQDEASSTDPEKIRGNFTREEIQNLKCGDDDCPGYKIPIVVGQANDYIGYVVTYREYSRGDHYRKALTAFGPRTSDYVNTRLVRMAASLRGAAPVADALLDPVVGPADEVLQMAKSLGAGAAGEGILAASETALPDDGGVAGTVLDPPSNIERFQAATFRWQGGSNWTDNPVVKVDRYDAQENDWKTVATQEGGEVVLILKYDSLFPTAPLDWALGGKIYEWTAIWEAFEETPPGTYQFHVRGQHRSGGAATPYEIWSAPFVVSEWSGLVVHDLRLDGGGVSFKVVGVEIDIPSSQLETDDDFTIDADEVHYPDIGSAGEPYIDVQTYETHNSHRFCRRCTWRPWANTGKVRSTAAVLVERDAGGVEPFIATFDGSRWKTPDLALVPGDRVVVPAGAVTDEHDNVNGTAAMIEIGQ